MAQLPFFHCGRKTFQHSLTASWMFNCFLPYPGLAPPTSQQTFMCSNPFPTFARKRNQTQTNDPGRPIDPGRRRPRQVGACRGPARGTCCGSVCPKRHTKGDSCRTGRKQKHRHLNRGSELQTGWVPLQDDTFLHHRPRWCWRFWR